MASISALTGVQWTDMNGAGLSANDEVRLKGELTWVNDKVIDTLSNYINGMSSTGSTSFIEMNVYGSRQEALRAGYIAATERLLIGDNAILGGANVILHFKEGGVIKAIRIRDMNIAGKVHGAPPVYIYNTVSDSVEPMPVDVINVNGRNYAVSYYNEPIAPGTTYTSTGAAFAGWDDSRGTMNTKGAADGWYGPLTKALGFNFDAKASVENLKAIFKDAGFPSAFDADTVMSTSNWQTLLSNLKVYVFRESSKLKTDNGGGIRTYNGRWYINGQEVDYLSVTFAVRVNQLYVINNSITDNLNQIQRNNLKIKMANGFADILNNMAPANSNATKTAKSAFTEIAKYVIANDLGRVWWASDNSVTARNAIGTYISQNRTDGQKFYVALDSQDKIQVKFNGTFYQTDGVDTNGNYRWVSAQTPATTVPNDLPKTFQDLFARADYIIPNFSIFFTGLNDMMPSTLSKLFSNGWVTDGGLSQNDFTAMTTELKSYTTNIDSNNQVIQTHLSQYNDKRSEVMDSMSNIIKGNSTALFDMGRNLGAI